MHLSGSLGDTDLSYVELTNSNKADTELPMTLDKLFGMGSNAINKQFQILDALAWKKPQVKQYQKFDIYIDIHPFEETSIWLGNTEGIKNPTPESYINACRIRSIFHEPLQ